MNEEEPDRLAEREQCKKDAGVISLEGQIRAAAAGAPATGSLRQMMLAWAEEFARLTQERDDLNQLSGQIANLEAENAWLKQKIQASAKFVAEFMGHQTLPKATRILYAIEAVLAAEVEPST